jgi:hypothetical protein
MTKNAFLSTAILIAALAPTSNAANLILNGGFELSTNSFSETQTPVDWVNVGHTDGVIAYSLFGTPAYEGSYFYDLGGFGQSTPGSGDGIQQTVATSVGTLYTLTFGLTGENAVNNPEFLNVLINGTLIHSFAVPFVNGDSQLTAPFSTQSLNYTATSTASTITFTVTGTNLGNNDPMIDGISFTTSTSSVPEPSTWLTCLVGLAIGAVAYRKSLSARV